MLFKEKTEPNFMKKLLNFLILKKKKDQFSITCLFNEKNSLVYFDF